MELLSKYRHSEHTLRRSLIRYMLVLTAVILAALLSTLALMGRFSSDRQKLGDALQLQLDFMERELLTGGENLAAMGVELSRFSGLVLDRELENQGLEFSQLQGNTQVLFKVQQDLMLPLRNFLLRSQGSGAFILLDTSVSRDGASDSRSGIYLQKGGTAQSDDTVLLYRGKPEVSKVFGIMPHRKWRLEFHGDLFSAFRGTLPQEKFSPDQYYTFSPVITLPGTSEQALLLQVPICGRDGTVYGLCGFEVSASYFKAHHPQPAQLPHLSFFLYPHRDDGSMPADKLAAGTAEGFFSSPAGPLTRSSLRGPLVSYTGENRSYAACVRTMELGSDGKIFDLVVLLPMADYSHILRTSFLETSLLTGSLLVFAVFCCLFFSQRFLLPILRSLEQIKSSGTNQQSGFQEIDDLFGFLAQQDRKHLDELRTLEDEKRDAQSRADMIRLEYEQVCSEYQSARKEVSRLTDLQLHGEESEAYQQFLEGIQSLTPTEKNIFQYYLEGKTVREITEITHTKESTLRYHNHNIYGKLGVKSLKQLMQFAVLMQAENGTAPV